MHTRSPGMEQHSPATRAATSLRLAQRRLCASKASSRYAGSALSPATAAATSARVGLAGSALLLELSMTTFVRYRALLHSSGPGTCRHRLTGGSIHLAMFSAHAGRA